MKSLIDFSSVHVRSMVEGGFAWPGSPWPSRTKQPGHFYCFLAAVSEQRFSDNLLTFQRKSRTLKWAEADSKSQRKWLGSLTQGWHGITETSLEEELWSWGSACSSTRHLSGKVAEWMTGWQQHRGPSPAKPQKRQNKTHHKSIKPVGGKMRKENST